MFVISQKADARREVVEFVPGAEAKDFQWQLQAAYQSTDVSENEKISIGITLSNAGPIDPDTDDEGAQTQCTNLFRDASTSAAPSATSKPRALTKRVVFVSHRPAWRTDAVRGSLSVSINTH